MEDLRCCAEIVCRDSSFAVLDVPLYCYRNRPGSAVHLHDFDSIKATLDGHRYVAATIIANRRDSGKLLRSYWTRYEAHYLMTCFGLLKTLRYYSRVDRLAFINSIKETYGVFNLKPPFFYYTLFKLAFGLHFDVFYGFMVTLPYRIYSRIKSTVLF